MNNLIGVRKNKDLIKTRSSMNNFIGIRIGQRMATEGESYPSLLEDGNTFGLYIASDLTTITKDGSNLVSRWNDKLGSGHDLIGGAAITCPLWVAPDSILWDGANDSMQTVAGHAQPMCLYMVARQVTWTLTERLIDDGTTNFQFSQSNTASPGVRMLAGGVLGTNNNWTLNTYKVVRVFFNGASSKIQINATAALSGNAGANAAAVIRVGGALGHIEIKEKFWRTIVDTAPNEQLLYDYLYAKYAIT